MRSPTAIIDSRRSFRKQRALATGAGIGLAAALAQAALVTLAARTKAEIGGVSAIRARVERAEALVLDVTDRKRKAPSLPRIRFKFLSTTPA
jgi:NADP-dependent 3-hydroxy acid dehydrogenase YdfG